MPLPAPAGDALVIAYPQLSTPILDRDRRDWPGLARVAGRSRAGGAAGSGVASAEHLRCPPLSLILGFSVVAFERDTNWSVE